VCCVVCTIAITLFGAGACVDAQQASTAPAFEVATIKSAAPFDPTKFGPRISVTRATYTDETLRLLIAEAYGLKLPQVSGPKLIDSDQFDIVATIPEGAAKTDEPRMLQALLKERFKLAFHIEKREEQVYALVVGKNGAKLKPSPPDPPQSEMDAPLKPGESYAGGTKSKMTKNEDGSSTIHMGERGTQTIKVDMESRTMHVERSKMTMEDLAGELPVHMGTDGLQKYTVVDQTGLKGNYQVAMDYPLPGGSDPEGAGALTRSLDALGLKLERRMAPTDVYVIDHVEKPSEN
jgi:uncharacterized protein (TIGR03435 family)